jgi:hypothetical protein
MLPASVQRAFLNAFQVTTNTEPLRPANRWNLNASVGRAIAQAVSRRPLTVETRVRSRVSPCEICGGQSGTGIGFSPSTSVFPCQFHSTGAPLQGKTKKLFIFITGLHNKPQGCGASVGSAAGPFTTKKCIIEGLTRALPVCCVHLLSSEFLWFHATKFCICYVYNKPKCTFKFLLRFVRVFVFCSP